MNQVLVLLEKLKKRWSDHVMLNSNKNEKDWHIYLKFKRPKMIKYQQSLDNKSELKASVNVKALKENLFHFRWIKENFSQSLLKCERWKLLEVQFI